MPIKILEEHLESKNVRYTTLKHSLAYTAQEVAASAHIPGKQLAKTVMVKLDGKLAMAVVPAPERIDLPILAREAGYSEALLAKEPEFARIFPGCEVGAMPPFGNLWNVPVYVSETLAEDEFISFNAGTHTEIMTLAFSDYRQLVEPRILAFTKG